MTHTLGRGVLQAEAEHHKERAPVQPVNVAAVYVAVGPLPSRFGAGIEGPFHILVTALCGGRPYYMNIFRPLPSPAWMKNIWLQCAERNLTRTDMKMVLLQFLLAC